MQENKIFQDLGKISEGARKTLEYASIVIFSRGNDTSKNRILELNQISTALEKTYVEITRLPENLSGSYLNEEKSAIESRLEIIQGMIAHEKAIIGYKSIKTYKK